MQLSSSQTQLVHFIGDWLFYVFIFFFALSLLAYTISNYFAKDHNVREIRIINAVIAFLDFLISIIMAVITFSHWHLLFTYWNNNFLWFVCHLFWLLVGYSKYFSSSSSEMSSS